MSEHERTERAKRIRQMREGDPNGDGDADTDSAAIGDAPAETTDRESLAGQQSESGNREGATAQSADSAAPAVETPDDVSAPLPDAETLEAAVEDDGTETAAEPGGPDTEGGEDAERGEDEPAPGPAGIAGEATTQSGEETRVLEFELDGERYCLDIEYVEEIVEQETVTRVPNTPAFVEGVVDLRGQITTIVNPKEVLEKDDREASDLIVVFDTETFEDQGHVGWVVDDVHQVAPVTDEQVNDSPMEGKYINGIIDREDEEEFVIWTTPDLIFDEAE